MGSAAQAVNRGGYTYVDLSSAVTRAGEFATNFYGVVVQWDAPRSTKGPDMVCSLHVVDPTVATGIDPVELRVFAPDKAQLPHVRKPGDIIRVHRARVEVYKERPHIIASIGGLKSWKTDKRASFCIFDGMEGAPMAPYQTSSRTYHWDEREHGILNALRNFSSTKEYKIVAGSPSKREVQYRRGLHELIAGSDDAAAFGDLSAVVMAIDDIEVDNRRLVWVWDGNDSPPYPKGHTTLMEDASKKPNATEGDATVTVPEELMTFDFPYHKIPRKALHLLPTMGAFLPVIWNTAVVELPAVGSWVRLRNCNFRIVKGQLQGRLSSNRWFQGSADDILVDAYQKRLQQNLTSGWAPQGPENWVAHAPNHRDRPLSTFRQVAVDAVMLGAEETVAYRCLAKAEGFWARGDSLEQACIQAKSVPQLAQGEGYTEEDSWLYAMQLQLKDGSGTTLDVDVFGREGEEFFRNIAAPQDFSKVEDAKERLQTALKRLTDHDFGANNRWMEVCLLSYSVEIDGAAKRRYRLFDTQLVENLAQNLQ